MTVWLINGRRKMNEEKQIQKKDYSKWKEIYIKECRFLEIVNIEVNIKCFTLLIYI